METRHGTRFQGDLTSQGVDVREEYRAVQRLEWYAEWLALELWVREGQAN